MKIKDVAYELNVSELYVQKEILLKGLIPWHVCDGEAYIEPKDFEEYCKKKEIERQKALDSLVEQAQDLGFYDS